ncbi:ATP-binding cassette domain-containing protein, partial [Streptomyces sp. NPDC005918]|uniref:ATP-binding cassette domain-containing protein n=1 Tax=Streptomyces sp. NPDC005918 TaxID=3155454 RepID=UPI0033F015F2
MIEANELTKRYGTKTAVNALSFRVRPGLVTGFLGPNGAGKSTTLRMILGLDGPTGGSVTVAGRPFRGLGQDPGALRGHPWLHRQPRRPALLRRGAAP